MTEVVIVDAVRTPIGRFLGAFSSISAVDLGVAAVKGLFSRLDPGLQRVDQVLLGCARQAGLGPNPARQVAIGAGLGEETVAVTTNMACGSGLLAIIQAARLIAAGEAESVLAGGMENMTRVPFLLPKMREGYRMGHQPAVDAMYQDGFHCPLADQLMGATAETLATKYSIDREEQDRYALRSQERAQAAIAAGGFASEIVPVSVAGRKGAVTVVEADEHPRAGVTMEGLAKLPAVFDRANGTVTAGNSSGITDGASALLVMSADAARKLGAPILATLGIWEAAAVDPKIMGIGPVPAVRKLCERSGQKVGDFDLVELNEAFAAQVIACDRELELDPERLNVNGGSIALGHPIGATGARIATTLLHAMKNRDAKTGLATLCISGGQGLALSFYRG